MKQVTKCYNCGNVIRLIGSFKAQLVENIPLSIPNPDGVGTKNIIHISKTNISLCRDCADLAGYKVKGLDK